MNKFKKTFFSFCILSIFLAFTSCKRHQQKVIAKLKDGTVVLKYDYPDIRDTSTFTYLDYYPDGRLHVKTQIAGFNIVENLITYYESGKIYRVDSAVSPYNWKRNVWTGTMTRYSETGLKIAKHTVKNGIIEGPVSVFDSNGIMYKQYDVIKDSIKEGRYFEFYPNGAISVKATFKNDTLNGIMYFFSEKGDTTRYYYYDKGGMAMPYKKWLSGDTVLVGSYIDTNRSAALWKWLTKDGKEIKRKLAYPKNHNFPAPE